MWLAGSLFGLLCCLQTAHSRSVCGFREDPFLKKYEFLEFYYIIILNTPVLRRTARARDSLLHAAALGEAGADGMGTGAPCVPGAGPRRSTAAGIRSVLCQEPLALARFDRAAADAEEGAAGTTYRRAKDPTQEYDEKEPMSPAKIKQHEPTAVHRDPSDQKIVESGQEGGSAAEDAKEKARRSGMTKGTAGAD